MQPPPLSRLARRVRLVGAILILAALVGALAVMLPPYLDNLRLQRRIEALLARPEVRAMPEQSIRAAVAASAAEVGMPLSPVQVRVERIGDRVSIAIPYYVRVDLPFYTVDLHFSPSATSR